ncbi:MULTISPECIES: methyltransferase domain-containing protein [unclassified Sutcliffiella]|uniref:class I SAM-dependent methyltransferase n=1 Tax=unclassified Sutcliffiella TaxID=2837532 RepID=UPI0030D03248
MKLHLGCGEKYLHGFKHVDILPFDHVDYKTDINNLSIFNDSTVSEIYACHVLEHIKRADIQNVLKEWYRVLEVNGILRLAVPNFEAIVQEYLQNNNLSKLQGLLYGGQNYEYNFHYIAFDFNSIKSLLEDVGFKLIERYDWREFLPLGFDDYSRAYLPHMDQKGRLMSLNVIAYK